jgi:thymidylate synthase (FAD)
MRLIKPSFEIWKQEPGLEGIYKAIERAGRVCYRSEDKITEDSAKPFVDRMIKAGHCYTGDTEVLTENGWIKFRDYNGEKVAVINKDCSFKGFENPKRIVSYSYKGNFYYYPSLGIEVTDGHNMFGIFRESKNDFYKNNSYSLFKCNGYYKDNNGREKTLGERMFKTPRHCLKSKSLNPYGELIGFWLGDGCYSPETKNKLVFHLKKPRKIEYLKQLCEELGYIFEERKSNYYTVTNNNIGSSFNSLFYNNGKRISLQYFPSLDIAFSIIEGLINSDGSRAKNTKTITFTNTSKSIIDWLLIYAPICGYSISNRGISHNTTLHNPVYKVLLLDTNYTLNNDSRDKDSKVIITNKVEEVYCVTVSTGLIMVRGINGITTICGNCAMLEHGTVYLAIPMTTYAPEAVNIYHNNSYSKVNKCNEFIFTDKYGDKVAAWCVTTNLRVLVENDCLEDLEFLCEPTEFHEKRVCVHFVCDRGVSHEFVRHRVMSFAQESTRYCNYSKDKFSNELTFIIPCWCDDIPDALSLKDSMDVKKFVWGTDNLAATVEEKGVVNRQVSKFTQRFLYEMQGDEDTYIGLIAAGYKPQEARAVLSNSLKTELVMTGFVSDWKHFFELRCADNAHPQARELAIPLREEFIKRDYINE